MDTERYITWITEYWLELIYLTLVAVATYWSIQCILRIYTHHILLRRKIVWLELTPPSNMSKSSLATRELFNVIHGLHGSRSQQEKILGKRVAISFEIASSRHGGIRYLVHIERRHADSLKQAIEAYLPSIKVAEINPDDDEYHQVIEFKQLGHYAFPLAAADSFEANDPVSYLTSAMANLEQNEHLRLQVIVSPAQIAEARRLARRVLGNEDLLRRLNSKQLPLLDKILDGIHSLIMGAADLFGEMISTTSSNRKMHRGSDRSTYEKIQIQKREKPARTLSTFEHELMQTMHEKLNQPLFRVNLRVGVKMNNKTSAAQRITAIKTSLHAFTVPSYQTLRQKINLSIFTLLLRRAYRLRLPALFNNQTLVLSSSELASLYHFPVMATQTDNLVTSLSRTLAAPLSLKQDVDLDVVIGVNHHHGVKTQLGLTESERERHMYIIGGTGNGKTTMLQYQIIQDMQNGKGVAVIDPHGDMAETLLRYVPEDRIKDVIYFNPDDISRPIGMNLLEIPEGLSEDEEMREKDLVTEALISVFRKIFSDEDTGGHRIEYVLRNAIQTALTVKDATIFTVFDLLNDPTYRSKVVAKLDNKDLINFWKHELGKAGDMQKVKMSAGITAKIGRFLFSASAKRILEQPKSTINFEDILDQGKILICNFSKGLIGEDTSELFGITILAKLQLASLRRARVKQTERKPFFLYVDEFQNFATTSFVQMLSESRKYRLFLTMAEQSTSQQKDQQMVQIILANVGTVICFRTGNPADEKLLLPLFSPFIEEGEISNQPPFDFYARFASTKSQEPLSGQTILLESEGIEQIAEEVRKHSRSTYGNDPIPKKNSEKTTARNGSPKTSVNTRRSKNAPKTHSANPEDDRE